MKTLIEKFEEYLLLIDSQIRIPNDIILYRGQSGNYPLLPSLFRDSKKIDKAKEAKIFDDFQRRSFLLIDREFKNDWEWLVYGQHFGLRTRLLDWTSNPLTALWFACSEENRMNDVSYVYILRSNESMIIDIKRNTSPFAIKKTKILRPTINNPRIAAQIGWFTIHHKINSPLEKNLDYGVTALEIPASSKRNFLKKLSSFGINHKTMYPDISGLCSHLNWKYFKQ